MAQHETRGRSVDWLTPGYVLDAFPLFDLDPCGSPRAVRQTAGSVICRPRDGLAERWFGRVWLNPPYGRGVIEPWLEKLAAHDNGVALLFARTDARWFHDFVFGRAAGLRFLAGRLSFIHADGATSARQRYGGNAACGSVLVAYGQECCELLRACRLEGGFVAC